MVCSSRLRNCRGIELSSRDFKTVAISVTRAKLYCINTWYAQADQKLSRYRTIEQGLRPETVAIIGHSRPKNCRGIELSSRDFKTVAISVTRGLKTVEHIEQGLENCRGIELSSRDLKTVESSISSRDLKTVEVSNYRAGT